MTKNRRFSFLSFSPILLPVIDFIYPPVCFTCDRRRSNRASKICDACWQSMRKIDATDPTWIEIQSRLEEGHVAEGMLSCFLFEREGKLQEIIHLLKYGSMKSIGVQIGAEIGHRIAADERLRDADYCIPVPLHKLRLRERGYNQCDYLCRGIVAVTGIPTRANVLLRTKATRTQTELRHEERRKNVANAFSINPDLRSALKGKKLLLVDDVITTGSTIAACAEELYKAGAARVIVVSAALAK